MFYLNRLVTSSLTGTGAAAAIWATGTAHVTAAGVRTTLTPADPDQEQEQQEAQDHQDHQQPV